MRRVPLLFAVALAAPLIFCFSRDPRPAETDRPAAETDDADTQSDDPDTETGDQPGSIWANAACYVCHTLFVKEELSKVHLKEKVTCIKCHGLSAAHANDENVGATPPDVVFKRCQIDRMCLECHKTHDAPAREVLARFFQRRLSRKSPPACTDCHGRHKIEQPADKQRT